MTYLQVLVTLVLVPCLFLVPTGVRGLATHGIRGRVAVPVLAVIAFVYTTPWDNYLIWRGVWDSPEDRIIGRLGYVPVEEYLFFLLQPVLTGLWYGTVLRRRPMTPLAGESPGVRRLGAAVGLTATLAGLLMLRADSTLYLGAILAWAGPVVTGIWWFIGHHLWQMRGSVTPAVAVPTAYLWVVDRLAIGDGTWAISEQYTVGVNPLGLPVEEALFFLVTNVMIVFGMAFVIAPGIDTESAPAPGKSARTWPLAFLVPAGLVGVAWLSATRPESLGIQGGRLHPCPPTPNCVRSGGTGGPDPFELVDGPDVWDGIVAAVSTMPRTRIVDRSADYLHAEARSLVFRFVDDLELLLDREAGVVHYRSASRVGSSDLGVNRRRVRALGALLAEAGLIRTPGEDG